MRRNMPPTFVFKLRVELHQYDEAIRNEQVVVDLQMVTSK